MNFDIPPEFAALRDRTRQFIAEQVIPLEGDPRHGPHGPSEDLRRERGNLCRTFANTFIGGAIPAFTGEP